MEKKTRSSRISRKSTASQAAAATAPPPRSPHSATPLAVHTMTSRDFQLDINAHIEVAAHHLKDDVYLSCFKAAIQYNKHLFRGRTVLDVGCGVGILSLFAAKAGAARVYAVDCSNVVDYTRQIVHDNGYDDVIQVIKGRVEDIKLPATAQVDIIMCNWMGYSLLFQAICDAVIFARDKWLKPGGLIFPDVARLFMVALEDNHYKNERIEWWNNVYGVNMKCMREFALSEPSFQTVQPQQLLSTQFGIKYLNLYTAQKKDLKFRCKYILKMQRSGHMDGVVTYFSVLFSKSHTGMGFSTDPYSPHTHWMQTVFYFDKPVYVNADQLYYGGIEMYSTQEDGDLHNMEVGFEMYSGDPQQLHLETEMRWKLKPHAELISRAPGAGVGGEGSDEGQGNDKVVANATPATTQMEHFLPITTNSVKSQTLLPKSCSIEIGDHVYPVEKRVKKAKYNKKG